MSAEISCRECHADFEPWNGGSYLRITYCPHCGAKLLEEQSEALYTQTTIVEISNMIRAHLIDMLEDSLDVSADELAQMAWYRESCNGAVFCLNYPADRFAVRHKAWVNSARECILDAVGDEEFYTKMYVECMDRFLVSAFIYATEHYVLDQLGIDSDEGDLSGKRRQEIVAQIKEVEYDGWF